MVDEDAYRAARDSINPVPCAFEKALLAGCAACALAERHLLAERETVNCRDAVAQRECSELRMALREHFAFVLKLVHADQPAPHGKELKVHAADCADWLMRSTAATQWLTCNHWYPPHCGKRAARTNCRMRRSHRSSRNSIYGSGIESPGGAVVQGPYTNY